MTPGHSWAGKLPSSLPLPPFTPSSEPLPPRPPAASPRRWRPPDSGRRSPVWPLSPGPFWRGWPVPLLRQLPGSSHCAASLRGLTAGVSARLGGLPALKPAALVIASAGKVQPLVHKARAVKDSPAVQRLAPAVTVADGFLKGTSFKFLVDGPTKMLGEAVVKAGIKRLPGRFAVSDKFNIVGQSAYLVRNVADSESRVGRVVNLAGEGYDRIEKVVTAANVPSTYWAQSAPAKTGAGRADTAKPAGAAGIGHPRSCPPPGRRQQHRRRRQGPHGQHRTTAQRGSRLQLGPRERTR